MSESPAQHQAATEHHAATTAPIVLRGAAGHVTAEHPRGVVRLELLVW
ncbi:MAG: hypothetical protein M3N45_03000 [Actinomycetota bacterium]|nr:hypothetical protein [Actinomycetota bacterium]